MTYDYCVSKFNKSREFHHTLKEASLQAGFSEPVAESIAQAISRLERRIGKSVWNESKSTVGSEFTFIELRDDTIYIWRKPNGKNDTVKETSSVPAAKHGDSSEENSRAS